MPFTKDQLGIISDLLWSKYEDVNRRGLLERRGLADWEVRLKDTYEVAAEEADRQWDGLRK